jgi:hypothetical protein
MHIKKVFRNEASRTVSQDLRDKCADAVLKGDVNSVNGSVSIDAAFRKRLADGVRKGIYDLVLAAEVFDFGLEPEDEAANLEIYGVALENRTGYKCNEVGPIVWFAPVEENAFYGVKTPKGIEYFGNSEDFTTYYGGVADLIEDIKENYADTYTYSDFKGYGKTPKEFKSVEFGTDEKHKARHFEGFGERMSWSRFANALNKSSMGWDWDTEWFDDGVLSLSDGDKTLGFRVSWQDQGDEDRYDIPHTLMGVEFAPEDKDAVPEKVISEINASKNIPALVRALQSAVREYGR